MFTPGEARLLARAGAGGGEGDGPDGRLLEDLPPHGPAARSLGYLLDAPFID